MSVLETLQTADLSKDFHAQLIACLPHLRAYARVITGNRDLADDLVHDAVVRALAASHQFQLGTNFKAWLFTILRNQNTSNFRKNRMAAIPLEEISEDVYHAQPNQEERLTLKELERAVKALPRHRREALSLIVVHGFSYEEAAKVCRCAVGTIKSRVARARTELYDRLLGSDEETRTTPGKTGTLVSQGGVGGDIESQSRRKAASRATPQAFVERWPGMFARSR